MISNILWTALYLFLGAIVILFISCCGFLNKKDEVVDDLSGDDLLAEDFPADIVNVPSHNSLYYSIDTLDVYSSYVKDDIEYLDVFTSNNRACKYVNGRIVEVLNNEVVAIVHTATLPD